MCGPGRPCWEVGHIKKGTSPTTPVRNDIYSVLPHPTISSVAFALGDDFQVLRTSDSGNSWEYISARRWNGTDWVERPGEYWPVEVATGGKPEAALAIDSGTPPHLYLAGGCLYRGTDLLAPLTDTSRPAWLWVPAPLRKQPCPTPPYIVAVATTPGDPNDLWLCYEDGRVFRTIRALDDPPPWHRVYGPATMPSRTCESLEINSAGTALVTFGGTERPNIYRVRSTGVAGPGYSWIPLTSRDDALPEDAFPYQATAHPMNEDRVYVATEVGVFERLPSGDWQALPGIPRQRTQSLFWHDEDLYIGTYGAGLYVIRNIHSFNP